MLSTRERRWWNSQEDEILKSAVQAQCNNPTDMMDALQSRRHGSVQNWNDIASLLTGRTNKDCRKRWSKIQVDIQKGVWTREEDERLQQAVQQLGFKWSRVATMVQCRNADQCAKRWQQTLRPGLKHTSWTPEDDEILLAAIRTHDNNWKQISLSVFPDRSTHDIRNRSLLLGRRSRNTSATEHVPAQLQTPSSDGDETVLCRDGTAENDTNDGISEGTYSDGRDILVDPDLGVKFSSVSGFQDTHELPMIPNSAGAILDQTWFGPATDMQNQQRLSVPFNDWLSWSNPFEGSPLDTSGSQLPWWENGPADQHCFPGSVGVCEVGGKVENISSMGGSGVNVDTSIEMQAGDAALENEQKGSVTLTLNEVDPTVAHEIMGSILKHSAGLRVRYVFNGK
ncbi:hypothetical protein N7519_010518 [Penicillium mononematosum]|uniref:uncharacterized protein n=1 Tax=Penicillium mononematosum TaxID=268346 RepID=UPI002547A185|nr:uncharacterized protein N7519_010518 [Penicillium mononematosum]KAJ6180057.1 hypothetical protein N7519_010518 [Penicillium mononematosum]